MGRGRPLDREESKCWDSSSRTWEVFRGENEGASVIRGVWCGLLVATCWE